ncbi:MAG: sugar ABC transporter permease [Bacilli bacterium]|jgi:multiple sugar transport system permease protein
MEKTAETTKSESPYVPGVTKRKTVQLGHNQLKLEKILLICVFLIIPLTSLILFTYVPLFDMVRYSMYHYNGYADPEPVFVANGADKLFKDNYYLVFKNPDYWKPLQVSGVYLIGSFVQIAIALYFATIFYFRPKGAGFFKAVIFIPSLLNGVAISLMFLLIFKNDSSSQGVLNSWIIASGGQPVSWFNGFWRANLVLAFISVWRYLGNNMVMFAGTMESVSKDEIEASEIDGAGKWQQFLHILLPDIKDIVFLNLILAVNGAVQVFEIPYVMQPSNPYTKTFIMKTMEIAFNQNQIGLAAALGIVMLLIVSVIALFQKAFEKKTGAN